MSRIFLRVRIEGPAVRAGQIPLRDLVHFGRQFQTALDRVARVLAGQISIRRGQPPRVLRESTALRVLALEKGSVGLVMDLPRVQPSLPGMDLGEQALEALLTGLDRVRSLDPELPPGYDLGVLIAWRDLGQLIGRGVEQIEFELKTPRAQTYAIYDYPLHTRVIERIAGPEENLVVLEGRLLMADFKETRLRCRLHPPAGKAVLCTFDEEMADEISHALRHYVRIRGIAETDPLTGEIRSLEIRDLETLDAVGPLAPPTDDRPFAYPMVDFWEGASAAELAEIQGVQPVQDLDDLWGNFWPEEEPVEDFLATVRQWRREGFAE